MLLCVLQPDFDVYLLIYRLLKALYYSFCNTKIGMYYKSPKSVLQI